MRTESILSEGRWALRALQTGATLVVLAALPYPLFQLDRYTFVKELVLLAAALAAALLCIGSARKLTVFMVDALVAGFLALSLVSALFAANGWLAARALGVSIAGAGLFWAARAVARAGHGARLLAGLAIAVVLGAATGLIQAYGLVTSELASATRAPGGTFGNRNFMAHLVAIGLPVLILVTLQARRKRDFALGAAGVALAAAALVLSRSRAGWLGAAACGIFLAVEGLWVGRLWADQQLRRRVRLLAGIALGGLLLALVLPNRLNWRSDSPYLDSLTGVANYKEGSGRGRLIQYGNTLDMAGDHPVLGVGPGNWPVHYPKYMSPGDPSFDADDIIPTNPWPSSDWMATLAERGLPASLLLLLVGGSIALGAWARVRSGARRRARAGRSHHRGHAHRDRRGGRVRRGAAPPRPHLLRLDRGRRLDLVGPTDTRGRAVVPRPTEADGFGGDRGRRAAGPEPLSGGGDGPLERREPRGAGAGRQGGSRELPDPHAPGAEVAGRRPMRPGPSSRRARARALPQSSGTAGRASGVSGNPNRCAKLTGAGPRPYSTHHW